MTSTTQRNILPASILGLKGDADKLLADQRYIASIFQYALYIDQSLITTYLYILRDQHIDLALSKREEIFEKLKRKPFSFGNVIDMTIDPILERLSTRKQRKLWEEDELQYEELGALCNTLRKIRNKISAHPQFTLMLDPKGLKSRKLSDSNYYRKVARWYRNFIRKELGGESSRMLDEFISNAGFITMYGNNLESKMFELQEEIQSALAHYSKFISEQITEILETALA